jgi:hypothetical protein
MILKAYVATRLIILIIGAALLISGIVVSVYWAGSFASSLAS